MNDEMIEPTDAGVQAVLHGVPPPAAAEQGPVEPTAPDEESLRIAEALQKHKNNRSRVAVELGISRETLYKKLHRYGLIGAV